MKATTATRRGDILCHKTTITTSDGQSGDVYLTAWFDNREVHLLSSYAPMLGSCKRNVAEDNVRGVRVDYHELEIARPTTVRDYNLLMSGTDEQDQKASYYRYEHKTIKWIHRIFTHFVMSCCVNANILYNWTYPADKIVLKNFIKSVIVSIAGIEESGIDDDLSGTDDEGEEGEVEIPARKTYRYSSSVLKSPTVQAVRLSRDEFYFPGKTTTRLKC